MLRPLLVLAVWLGLSAVSLLAAGGILCLQDSGPRPVARVLRRVAARPAVALTPAEAQLVNAINRYRARWGRRAVTPHPALMAAARGRTNSTPRSAHRVNGQAPWTAARQCGWRGNGCGENLAWGSATPDGAVFSQWAHSPGHNRNQLGNWNYVGVGVRGRTYVAIYGR